MQGPKFKPRPRKKMLQETILIFLSKINIISNIIKILIFFNHTSSLKKIKKNTIFAIANLFKNIIRIEKATLNSYTCIKFHNFYESITRVLYIYVSKLVFAFSTANRRLIGPSFLFDISREKKKKQNTNKQS